jgi:two-component system sensor histidine kinase SenX3
VEIVVAALVLTGAVLGAGWWRQARRNREFRLRVCSAVDAGTDAEAALRKISELDAQRRRAGDEAALLAAAGAMTELGIVIKDALGNEIYENDTAAAYRKGLGGDAVVGLRIQELLAMATEGDEPVSQELEIYTPTQKNVLIRAIPLFVQDRRLGTVAFVEDYTNQSRFDSIRRDFVANASHELKTPLGALRLLTEALANAPDEATRRKLNERIQAEAARMTRLIEDILDLSLIETGQRVRGVVELRSVVAEAVEQVSLVAETLGVAVRSSGEQVEIFGDHRRLVSAVANLLENAITYTKARGSSETDPVEVTVSRHEGNAVIEVQDHGIGIPERHQSRIFERFYRVDRGRSRASGGTGLGLAIVRNVVDNHWGEIEVESAPGRGTTFRILLPAREDSFAQRSDNRG